MAEAAHRCRPWKCKVSIVGRQARVSVRLSSGTNDEDLCKMLWTRILSPEPGKPRFLNAKRLPPSPPEDSDVEPYTHLTAIKF